MEALALEHLARQSFEAFLPLIRLRKRRADRWQLVVEPLFSGYLFVQADPAQQDVSAIRSTRGTVGLVKFGDRLLPLPDTVIAELKRRSLEPLAGPEPFSPGDPVRFAAGPFRGLSAIYQQPRGEDRAAVLLSLLGRSSLVEVAEDHLIKP